MKYLIFSSTSLARARSRAAYVSLNVPITEEGDNTNAVWFVIKHQSNNTAALLIPENPDQAGLGLSQEDYNNLLTSDERSALLESLPSDWNVELPD